MQNLESLKKIKKKKLPTYLHVPTKCGTRTNFYR